MKYVLIIISILAVSSAYFLIADSPVMIMQTQQSGYENVYIWAGDKNPIALPLSDANKSETEQLRPQYFFSESRAFYGKVIHNNQKIKVSWYDADNTLQGSFSEEWESDIPLPRYYISSNRNQIFSVDIYNRIRFFGAEGKPEYEISLFTDMNHNTENNTYCQYIGQQDLLLIGFKQVFPVSQIKQGYHSYVTLIDLEGNELFSTGFPGWQINGVSAAENGAYIIIPLHKYELENNQFVFRTIILDNKGETIAELPLQHNKAEFNSDGTLVSFFKNEQAWLYDITKNKIVQDYSIKAAHNIFISGLFIDEKNIFVLQEGEVYKESSDWAFQNITLNLIDFSGNLLQQQTLDDITQFTPVLTYDRLTQQLFVGHRNGYLYYTINH